MSETVDETKAITLSLDKRVELLEFSIKSNSKDHKEFFERITKLEINDARQSEQYTAIIKEIAGLTHSIKTLTEKLTAIEAKPGKRWEGIVDKAIWAFLAAVIAFLLAKVGLAG